MKMLLQILTVSTVEDFWSVFNHLERASKLRCGSSLMFFKKDIKPSWEEEANIRGGRWIIHFDKTQRIRSNRKVRDLIDLFI